MITEENILAAIDSIYRTNLAVHNHDRVLVFTDAETDSLEKIGKLVAERGRHFSPNLTYSECSPTGCHGTEPPEELWEKAFGTNSYQGLKKQNLLAPILHKKASPHQLKKAEEIILYYRSEAVSVVIALSYYSTSHTVFRDLLNRLCGARYASMPLFDETMLSGPMTADWNALKLRSDSMARRVDNAVNILIKTENGTVVSMSKKGRIALTDTGIITKAGQFSNLPAGEVFLAPLEGTSRGKLVLDWAPTRKLKHPVTLFIEEGLAVSVEGNEPFAGELEKKFSEADENRNIAELGIGTNDKATRPDNILESEKIFGTIHIALGDNSSFGGTVRTSFHQDFVFFRPTVTLLGKDGTEDVLLDKGTLT